MNKSFINKELHDLYKKISQHKFSYLFLQKIEEIIETYPIYSEVISHPIDLTKIEKKVLNKEYNNANEFKDDIKLMLDNCRLFNSTVPKLVEMSDTLQQFFENNYKRTESKILKHIEKIESDELKKRMSNPTHKNNYNLLYTKSNNGNNNNNNVTALMTSGIFENLEEEKVFEKVFGFFEKVSNELNLGEGNNNEEKVNSIAKSIYKRNKSNDELYEEAYKWILSKVNDDKIVEKYKFGKKFRKLLKLIKDEVLNDSDKMNIRMSLNTDINVDEIKQRKDLIENAISVTQKFIDSQKLPEIYKDIDEYPIE